MNKQFYCLVGADCKNEECKSCPARNLHSHTDEGKCLSQVGGDCPPCMLSFAPPAQPTSEVTIKVNPNNDEAVVVMAEKAGRFLGYAQTRTIQSVDDEKLATDDLSLIGQLLKTIEDKRKEYAGPIDEHLKAVNLTFKRFTAPLHEASAILRNKILEFHASQKRLAAEAEEINRLRMEAARREMELKGELSESVVLVDAPPEPPKTVHASISSGSVRQIPEFEVVDMKLLPPEFLMVNEVALGKQIRAGRRDIPGVRIWMKDSLTIRGK
ncbi:MAG: hypothetical protein ABIG63_00155 [Chloroflexota bacterium]